MTSEKQPVVKEVSEVQDKLRDIIVTVPISITFTGKAYSEDVVIKALGRFITGMLATLPQHVQLSLLGNPLLIQETDEV